MKVFEIDGTFIALDKVTYFRCENDSLNGVYRLCVGIQGPRDLIFTFDNIRLCIFWKNSLNEAIEKL